MSSGSSARLRLRMVTSAGSPNSAFAAAIVDAISGQTDMRKMRQNRAIDVVDGARSPRQRAPIG
jgi:hypothetical protein